MLKERGDGFLRYFQQLRSHRDKIETRNRKEIAFSSRIVPWGISVAEEPYTALNNAAHVYSDQANLLMGMQRRLPKFDLSALTWDILLLNCHFICHILLRFHVFDIDVLATKSI